MDDISKSERELLKAIHRLVRRSLAVDGPAQAHTGDLAEFLELSPSTVTTAVKRLADRGLVDHVPYRGVELTAAGEEIAVASIRRHRIVERMLVDLLRYDGTDADRLATAFEHELPQEVEDRIADLLDHPTTCPHGHPIPDLTTETTHTGERPKWKPSPISR